MSSACIWPIVRAHGTGGGRDRDCRSRRVGEADLLERGQCCPVDALHASVAARTIPAAFEPKAHRTEVLRQGAVLSAWRALRPPWPGSAAIGDCPGSSKS